MCASLLAAVLAVDCRGGELASSVSSARAQVVPWWRRATDPLIWRSEEAIGLARCSGQCNK